ncbi:DNA primase [Campylobacter helveticus]|uniref:DNA primase n=1 Tax=Campylobacter helveticus TaxID=28898 RepID=UPI0022EB69B1|nr:DNA primase [Campylobacter helveticus]
MIAKSSIELLNQRADIVHIISHFVEVRRSGASYVCVCPFHDDRNPSMHINSQKGFYHCFACGAGGDVFKFIMEFERVNFAEAVEKVAQLSNFTLTYTKEKEDNKKDVKHILPLLNAFYKQNLASHREVLDYLYQRKLNDEDIKKFELGYAVGNEESLRLLKNEQIANEDALYVGAVKKDDRGGVYASFIHRITFPIYDYKGLLVGFGGRTLNANNAAKYVNSPQSAFFDKSRIFYAFNLAKESIAKQKEMIICEGYMDAIAFHKAGFTNAVAVLGTALTEHHIPLIRRYDARVLLCFDNDEAGRRAAFRSAFLLSVNKIDGKVVLLEGGKDPAELVANGETKKLHLLLEKAMELGEFYIRELLRGGINSALDKQKALENVQKYTFLLESLVANSYTSLVAKLLGVEQSLIVLSKNHKASAKTPLLQTQKTRVHLSELELLTFLRNSSEARVLFLKMSDKACLKHKELCEKILNDCGLEDSDIRELELRNLNGIKSLNEFLCVLCKVNLAFFNALTITKAHLGLKKQLLSLLDKNAERLKKQLDENALFEFYKEALSFIKNEKDEQILEARLKTWHKIFAQKSFNALDFGLENAPF